MEAKENKKIKKSVRIRLEKEAQKEAIKSVSGRQGAVAASLRNFPSAPRKMRLVADMIRGQRVSIALNLLKFDAKFASSIYHITVRRRTCMQAFTAYGTCLIILA